MRRFYRINLGNDNKYKEECHNGGFIGAYFGICQDVSDYLNNDWEYFNTKVTEIYNSSKNNSLPLYIISTAFWSITKGLNIDDVVICQCMNNTYMIGIITSNYIYHSNTKILPHRRSVKWIPNMIKEDKLDKEIVDIMKSSPHIVLPLNSYLDKMDIILSHIGEINDKKQIVVNTSFAYERHLESYLIKNWETTIWHHEEYQIYIDENEINGRQYQLGSGYVDILAYNKKTKTFLVIELKKDCACDRAIGQVLRYMGHIKKHIAKTDQNIKGVIVAASKNDRLDNALRMVENVEFHQYEMSFRLNNVAID